ncbi:MAG: NAD(P)H-dependent oxidoreductase [Candidatus Fonsibacter sp.]
MYLYSGLDKLKKDISVGIVGCGKFISMFLSQYNHLKRVQIKTIIDLNIKRAKENCRKSGLSKEVIKKIKFVTSLDKVLKDKIDIFIEATGDPIIGTEHAVKIIKNKKNIIMVNVEADVVCGKYLSDLAKKNNVVYSMAYGDQPSLIMELIEWAKLNGFKVVSAGKGTKYHPSFEYSTPDTVWKNYGMTDAQAKKAGMNPKMFNSFTTGDKSSIEMAAVSNASGLKCPKNGLTYPPVGVYEIANKVKPKSKGGVTDFEGQVEVISSIDRKKKNIPNDLRWGVYIVIKAQNSYAKACFKEYGMVTDTSGNYSALWRPYHYIGLELAQSIYSIALEKKATGQTKFFNADVASIAKKNIKPGEILDGEGGFFARGRLVPAKKSITEKLLPLGLSGGCIVIKNIKKDNPIKLSDVLINWNPFVKEARDYQKKLAS